MDFKALANAVKAAHANEELYTADRPTGLKIVREPTEEEVLELKAARREYFEKQARKELTHNPFKILKKAA